MEVPTKFLGDGVEIPVVGFGGAFGNWTGQGGLQGFLPEQGWRAFREALDRGYRHFDVAHCYGTERHLGAVLGRALEEARVERDDLFITTKLAHPAGPGHVAMSHLSSWDWKAVGDLGQRVRDDFERSKENLGLGTVDLLLVHWPGDFGNDDPGFAKEARLAVWEAFEFLHGRGDARAIGVCNFTPAHLQDLLDAGRAVPKVNQVELHPYCRDEELVAFCRENEIAVEAYAPFASGAFGLLKDPVISRVAREANRSVGQTILRWHLQQGHIVLPKSTNGDRIAQNIDLFDFELGDDQMEAISSVAPERPLRTTPDPSSIV